MSSTLILLDRDKLRTLDLSPFKLSRDAKIHSSNIYRILDGQVSPTLGAARRIARSLGWPLDKIRFPKEL